MTIQWNIDVGQLIVSGLILLLAVISWFIKKEITTFGERLDKHEDLIFKMNGTMQQAIGQLGVVFQLLKVERRKNER